ncbi:uncharacterized protein LOC119264964 [Pygocentrus nattereri]|uniref:uncharacterized protein LOC119264964 n=1 Tax=Pygocentrus nattereri TaxID=42514 RepID=UPI0018910D31|nr:uncharacterized protein LOC119264964 [Pygocentrus nattereri]
MKRNLLIILIIASGVFGADQVGPNDQGTDVFGKEGESVTLKCSYDSSSDFVWLYWYRQYPNRALQYLLYRGARSKSGYDDTADSRFESTALRLSTELSLKEVRLADTALYYCVLSVEVQKPSDTKSLRCFTKTLTPSVSFEHQEIKMVISVLSSSPGLLLSCTVSLPLHSTAHQIIMKLFISWVMLEQEIMQDSGSSDLEQRTTHQQSSERFHSKLNSSTRRAPLMIQKLSVSDSAVYYCALQPTVTT